LSAARIAWVKVKGFFWDCSSEEEVVRNSDSLIGDIATW
jgi:hypothetical protein